MTINYNSYSLLLRLSSDRLIVERHVCLSLIVSELLLVIGVFRAPLDSLWCPVVSAGLLYFIQCVFTWLAMDSVRVLTTAYDSNCCQRSRHRSFYILSYSLPALVFLLAALDSTNYCTQHHCWLNIDRLQSQSVVFFVPAIIALVVSI